jgi:hypothetical protein
MEFCPGVSEALPPDNFRNFRLDQTPYVVSCKFSVSPSRRLVVLPIRFLQEIATQDADLASQAKQFITFHV